MTDGQTPDDGKGRALQNGELHRDTDIARVVLDAFSIRVFVTIISF